MPRTIVVMTNVLVESRRPCLVTEFAEDAHEVVQVGNDDGYVSGRV